MDRHQKNESIAEKALFELCQAFVVASQSTDTLRRFLKDLCTPAEISALSERWRVCKLVDQKQSYRDIHDQTGASVTTIGRVARFLKDEPHQGYRFVLDHQQKMAQDAPKNQINS